MIHGQLKAKDVCIGIVHLYELQVAKPSQMPQEFVDHVCVLLGVCLLPILPILFILEADI